MINTRTIGRIGILAAGLGIGAAIAATPGTASADTSSDWWSSIDSALAGAALPAASPTDFQISFNGTDLFPTIGNDAYATTTAGDYGLAIAYGDGAHAFAEGGTGDYAFADGTYANAEAGSLATGATGNNYDTAVDIGNNDTTALLDNTGAYAGNGSLQVGGTEVGTDSNDSAYDFGNNSAGVTDSGAFSGYYGGVSGNGDTAYDAGNNSGKTDGAFAGAGNNDFASDSGNNTAAFNYAYAGEGNDNSAIADTSFTTNGSNVVAYEGNDNYAYVYGPDNSTADAAGGSDVAYVNDPFSGATGPADSAVAGGALYTSDLAEVLFTHGNATAESGNLLYDIVSLFGNNAGSF